ncbi:MAG: tRNA (adenosine(37)-N6)-threonylcarbamoyltransferase complex ATPase subunit type 1 TsaE [Kiritimatiellae bacterium]|nr:tRNA (adenosine(37)-N6)-threonylcarbamoyltransferase complex ATPase subunit type 1 TsaE [Kiritimatiellia bacterium]
MLKFEWDQEIISNSVDDTWAIAAALVSELPKRSVMALHGDLGAGKTCFVQGMAMALGIDQPVTSPTFTIVNEYHGSRYLCHMDLYRLSGADEVLALGFDEYLEADGIVAVEWAERAEEVFPADAIHVEIRLLEEASMRSVIIRKKIVSA